jgi:hypothetical protein
MRRSITAAVLAASLIVLSPGLPCYQAVAAEFEGGAPKGAPVNIPALNLPQINAAGTIPGAQIESIPGLNTGVIPTVPVLPTTVVPATLENEPGLNPATINPAAVTPNPGEVKAPLAETTLRTGAAEITHAQEGGDLEGTVSRFWTGSGAKGAGDNAAAVSLSETAEQSGLGKLSVSDLKNIAVDQKRSSAERMSAVKAIANRSDDPAKLALEEIGTVKPVGDTQDYEVRRQALRALADKGTIVSMPEISQQIKDELKPQLAAKKRPIFDWDGTWEKSYAQASQETGAALKAMADAGARPAILTGRPYATNEPHLNTIQEALAPLSPEQKKSIDVVSDRGARLFRYEDGNTPALKHEEAPWTQSELSRLSQAAEAIWAAHGTKAFEGEHSRSSEYSFIVYLGDGANLEAAASDLRKKLAELDVHADVTAYQPHDGKPARLLVTKYDKSTGVATLRSEGGKTTPIEDIVLVGDEFLGARNVDAPMAVGAPGALALAVGGSGDPRIDNLFVWDKQGHAAATEIAGAIAQPAPAKKASWFQTSKLGRWLAAQRWSAEGPKAPGPDDPVNMKTLLGNIIPSVVSMAAYMLVTLAFVGVAVPVVGWTGYGILMALSPMAGIAAAIIMGNIFKTMGARNAMVLNTALRIVSLSALPLFHLFGIVSMGSLLVGALAEGYLLSSIMTTSGAFLPALFPSKQIGNINGVMFMMFPLVQVLLGIWAHVGRFADLMSPFTIFAGAAALNAFIVLPLTWLLIPNTKLSQATAAAAPATPKAPLASRAKDFIKKFWKPVLALTAAIGLFAGLTWGLPALAAAGVGGKLIAAAAAFLKVHSSLTAPLPIVAALVYWISKTEGYKALREGKTAKITDAQKALQAKITELEAAGPAKVDELAAAQAELKQYSGRQLKSIGMMSLSTLMYYPLYLVAAPHVAEVLAGSAGKLEMAGQFLGTLFFGALLSTAARTVLPGKVSFKLPGGRKVELTTTRAAQIAIAALAGLFAATKVFAAATLLGTVGIALAGAAAAGGLIYLATRITDRGWIKAAGVGFAAIWLPFVVWSWPALIPFLTIKTAMLISLLAAGYVNGPNFVSLISYLMSNTERSENSKVTGVQGAFFNAAISTGYALLTIASGFLNPAYPAVLAILGIINLLIGGYFWRTASHLPGLSPTIFKRNDKKAPESKKAPEPPAPVITE